MDKSVETARENRDVTDALLASGLPNSVEDKVLDALEQAGVHNPVEDLMGDCLRNTVALRDALRNKGYDAIAVNGWVVDLDAHIIPRDMREAEDRGVVHWWVEVPIRGEWYTMDLASNLPDNRWGDLYIGPRPGAYRPHELDPDYMDEIRVQYDLEPPRGIFDESL